LVGIQAKTDWHHTALYRDVRVFSGIKSAVNKASFLVDILMERPRSQEHVVVLCSSAGWANCAYWQEEKVCALHLIFWKGLKHSCLWIILDEYRSIVEVLFQGNIFR